MASKSAVGHFLTFLLAAIVLPLLRAVPFLRGLADGLASFLGVPPQSSGKSLNSHQADLEEFYCVQAESYDATRGVLLKGREQMLETAARALLEKRDAEGGERRVTWIDIGGGTGYNIETMSAVLSKLRPGLGLFDVFDRVTLLDLTPSLCSVARKRFAKLGWDVDVVEGDAGSWRPDAWSEGQAGLVTFSYSREF
jgi:betaine lipid synthase